MTKLGGTAEIYPSLDYKGRIFYFGSFHEDGIQAEVGEKIYGELQAEDVLSQVRQDIADKN